MTDVEKKIRLTRFLREENMRNQMRIRNREEILYGSGRPVFSEEQSSYPYTAYSEDFSENFSVKDTGLKPTFRLRLIFACAIFAFVFYLDHSGSIIAGRKADELVLACLNWSAETKLIDFMSDFTYTLSDSQQSGF